LDLTGIQLFHPFGYFNLPECFTVAIMTLLPALPQQAEQDGTVAGEKKMPLEQGKGKVI
jgi:hypothetical protein